MPQLVSTDTELQCYHCGDRLPENFHPFKDKNFCCLGCKGVFQLLSEHHLQDYYRYNAVPGQPQKNTQTHFEYLDEPSITQNLIDYTDDTITSITLYIPAIHCSSCIWLLENLHQIHPAITQSRVDFMKKQVALTFQNQEISLRKVIEILVAVGYEPLISLQDVVKTKQKDHSQRKLIAKIAVAGFCFGNVMLFSFPEYFGLSAFEQQFKVFFGWVNIVFSIPVVFYSAQDYFISAWANLKNKHLNIDFPLALGILVMFVRSLFDIYAGAGSGFIDTLCGLVFFLLIGKWMQQHTYHYISFERDYRSYFPVAVTLLHQNMEKSVPLSELKVGDHILIRNQEIIPADTLLIKGDGLLDFSFVTGESRPIPKEIGELIYAGGRQLSGAIELQIVKTVSQSYLTQLWNNQAFKTRKNNIKTFSDTASKYFSILLLTIAFGAGIFWAFADVSKSVAAFTAVLIIACPCALALSSPFTLSAVLSIFDKNKFYLKNTAVIEELARVDTYIFDKTGTITQPDAAEFCCKATLHTIQKQWINDIARNSNHPLSRAIVKYLALPAEYAISDFEEIPGLGISGKVQSHHIRLGSARYLAVANTETPHGSHVHMMIDKEYCGYFYSKQQWRNGLSEITEKLATENNLHLLSGDTDHEQAELQAKFPKIHQMYFKQSPQDKLEYIQALQAQGKTTLMLGDGLNDAGALKQSQLGIAVTDNINNFSPSCDGILDGQHFHLLPQFIQQAKDASKIIRISFGISITYNIIGLFFAVQGKLSPLIAAILMPISTLTIIAFTTLSAAYYAHQNKLS